MLPRVLFNIIAVQQLLIAQVSLSVARIDNIPALSLYTLLPVTTVGLNGLVRSSGWTCYIWQWQWWAPEKSIKLDHLEKFLTMFTE